MPTHPLWRPFELADVDEFERHVVEGPLRAPVVVVPYDGSWVGRFQRVESQVRAALGERVLALEHIGSTSVPGLAAKPVVDVDLTVVDSAEEPAYVPDLETAGFVLRVREPDWEEHRLLTLPDRSVNLHVFSTGAVEPRRHLLFRDWLRCDAADRERYAATKTSLAARGFDRAMEYNNHKAALVYDIYERAFAADPDHHHDPRPRH